MLIPSVAMIMYACVDLVAPSELEKITTEGASL